MLATPTALDALAAFAVPRPRRNQCADAGCPGSTQAPTFALIALFAVAVLLVVLAVRLWRRGRRADDVPLGVTSAALAGVAVLCIVLFGNGFRHYGGYTDDEVYACQAWWQEAGLPSAAQGLADDESSVKCRQAALDAMGPAVGEGGLAGVVVGGVLLGVVWRRSVARRAETNGRFRDLVPGVDRRDA